MVTKYEIVNIMLAFESEISIICNSFIRKFQVKNPLKKWRNGVIQRNGYIDVKNQVEYSLHGSGCAVEYRDGKLISFDFDEDDNFYYSSFKIMLYARSIGENLSEKDFQSAFYELEKDGQIDVISLGGVRLKK